MNSTFAHHNAISLITGDLATGTANSLSLSALFIGLFDNIEAKSSTGCIPGIHIKEVIGKYGAFCPSYPWSEVHQGYVFIKFYLPLYLVLYGYHDL